MLIVLVHFFGIGMISYHRGSMTFCSSCPATSASNASSATNGAVYGIFEPAFQRSSGGEATIAAWWDAGCMEMCDPNEPGVEEAEDETFCLRYDFVRNETSKNVSLRTGLKVKAPEGCSISMDEYLHAWPVQDWDYASSLYFVMVIVSTVGYGESSRALL